MFHREPAANQRERADLFELRGIGEAAVDFLAVEGEHLRMAQRPPPRPDPQPLAARSPRRGVAVGDDQRRQAFAAVAHDAALFDPRRAQQQLLDLRRGDLLAGGQDEHFLLAADDSQVALGVPLAQIAGVEPAVFDRPRRVSASFCQ